MIFLSHRCGLLYQRCGMEMLGRELLALILVVGFSALVACGDDDDAPQPPSAGHVADLDGGAE